MKRSSITPAEFAIGLLVLGIIVLIPYSYFQPGLRRSHCQSNLKQVGLALQQYSADWNKRLPLVAVNPVPATQADPRRPYGWADAVRPYLETVDVFQCPSEWHGAAGHPWEPGYTDYYFNDLAQHMDLANFDDPRSTAIVGEVMRDFSHSTARFTRHSVPYLWRTHKNSPLAVHLGGSNYAFADGHVKWLRVGHAPLSCADGCMGACFDFCPSFSAWSASESRLWEPSSACP